MIFAIYDIWDTRTGYRERTLSVELPSTGTVLDLSSLASGYEVVLEQVYLACDGPAEAKRFIVSGDTRTMSVVDCDIHWNRFSDAAVLPNAVAKTYVMEDSDFDGLAVMLRVFRFHPAGFGTASYTYRIEYRKNGTRIGEERFHVPTGLFLRNESNDERIREVEDSQQLPRGCLHGIVTPEMIIERVANQSADSTAFAGSRAAEQPRVPASAASHL